MKRLLIRFDDLNPYMSLFVLKEIKNICTKYQNSVLLCVVPFCEDENLINGTSLGETFWSAMRFCQKQKAVIGLHGFNHKLFKNHNKQIFPISNKTEFCGVNIKNQFKMIEKGKNFLESKGLNISFFAAPAHSMDENTILVLRKLNIKTVSDGFFSSSTLWKGINWLPVKTWRENTIFLGSLNTVCKHPKEINGKYEFKINLAKGRVLTSFDREISKIKQFTFIDLLYHIIYIVIFKLNRIKRKIKIFMKGSF